MISAGASAACVSYHLFVRIARQDQVALDARRGNGIDEPVFVACSPSPCSDRYLIPQNWSAVLPLKRSPSLSRNCFWLSNMAVK